MGEQAEETLGPSSGQRMSSTGAESHDMVSGLGSLEYWDNFKMYSFWSHVEDDDYYYYYYYYMFVTSVWNTSISEHNSVLFYSHFHHHYYVY